MCKVNYKKSIQNNGYNDVVILPINDRNLYRVSIKSFSTNIAAQEYIKKIKGFETKDIYNNLRKLKKNIVYVGKNNLNKILYKETYKKNIIIFMGAGSISKIASNFVKINE